MLGDCRAGFGDKTKNYGEKPSPRDTTLLQCKKSFTINSNNFFICNL